MDRAQTTMLMNATETPMAKHSSPTPKRAHACAECLQTPCHSLMCPPAPPWRPRSGLRLPTSEAHSHTEGIPHPHVSEDCGCGVDILVAQAEHERARGHVRVSMGLLGEFWWVPVISGKGGLISMQS